MGGSNNKTASIAEEDRLRAYLYTLLSRLLVRPPDAIMLSDVAALSRDSTDLGAALGDLADRASRTDVPTARREYDRLFIGLGRGELLPYGSYYLTGFLNEKPLARLRSAMAQRGIARSETTSDPEDHAGSVLEMMAGLIDGRYGEPASLADQDAFFAAHLGNWVPFFFRDLEAAESADLYRPVGRIGSVFMEIEETAFSMIPTKR